MKIKQVIVSIALLIPVIIGAGLPRISATSDLPEMISYIVDPKTQVVELFWKNDKGEILGNIQQLKDHLNRDHKRLLFAMNGGMYKEDQSPLGLFIQKQQTITPLDTGSGNGNFYLKPNGIFYIMTDNSTGVCKTEDFDKLKKVKFATQSGPMLLINGQVNTAFRNGSTNVNIRNGVGILPGNKLLFAMSKEPVNFYDFTMYFKNNGCLNALYLDGFVSRTYLPEKKWEQTDGSLGVLIGSWVQEK